MASEDIEILMAIAFFCHSLRELEPYLSAFQDVSLSNFLLFL